MPVNTLSSLHSTTSDGYKEQRNLIFKLTENPRLYDGTELSKRYIHDDGVGIPTIGYGLNLRDTSLAQINASLLYGLGLDPTIDPSTLTDQNLRTAFSLIAEYKAGGITALTLIGIAQQKRVKSVLILIHDVT